jgi:serine protease Do
MGMFEDDFYSTKVSRNPIKPWDRWQPGLWRTYKSLWLVGGAATLAILLVVWLASSGTNEPEEQQLIGSPASESTPALGQITAAPSLTDYPKIVNDVVVQASDMVIGSVVSVISSGMQDNELRVLGMGSGFIFEIKGRVARMVTNHHVIQDATSVEIVTQDGMKRKATVIGKDRMTDLAVLEMDAEGILTVAQFGDSQKLRTGEFAIAIGNPLGLGFSHTITMGVISSPKRSIPISYSNDGSFDWEYDVIQTDAAINQGNSGGPLVNLEGKVIGINSMKISFMGVEGLAFAIPIHQAKPVLESLIAYGQVKRPFIGVSTVDLSSFAEVETLQLPSGVQTGLIVMNASGPAKDAGLRTSDVITQLDQMTVSSMLELRKYIYLQKKIGDPLEVTYYRDGKKQTLTLVLGVSLKE